MTLFAGLEQIVRNDVLMADHTWFRIGGPAKYYIEPGSIAELQEVVKRCRENEVPMFVLGGGANLLVDDAGVKGAVIHIAQGEFKNVTIADGVARASAGADMGKLAEKPRQDTLVRKWTGYIGNQYGHLVGTADDPAERPGIDWRTDGTEKCAFFVS